MNGGEMTEEMKFRAEVHVTCVKVCFSFLKVSVISTFLLQLYVITLYYISGKGRLVQHLDQWIFCTH